MSSILSRFLCRNFATKFNRGNESFAKLGRFYEEKCQEVISKLFEAPVQLVGGANDGGVDLIWTKSMRTLCGPTEMANVLFLGQCKNVQNKVRPEVIRALKGTVVSNRPEGTVGCLVTNIPPSHNILKYFYESQQPLMFFQVSSCDVNCKVSNLILLNHRFSQLYPHVQVCLVRGSVPPQYILRFN